MSSKQQRPKKVRRREATAEASESSTPISNSKTKAQLRQRHLDAIKKSRSHIPLWKRPIWQLIVVFLTLLSWYLAYQLSVLSFSA
ncbi:hypothetical protein FRB94_006217 [Tulasnella sp. JGI-2019a]|nr:hypothetical protein FRB93_001232 [Tulasnella sp. JGI-2019a]KAG8999354.1 hypothetical protein FRB94_006217 [Tulasnella sp. JGI-2019a]KAG9028566.1 hypothetical protein FRB95_006347 [Tulasnella sp. JGI-2019a]